MASSPRSFNRFPTRSFFYENLSIREASATIRYGIDTRKGLVCLSGDAGLGKTTLLIKISNELGPNIIGTMISHPRLSFSDILRQILRSLHADSAGEDKNTLLRNCQLVLRARAQQQQIVALIVDNAQHLTESTLGQLMHTFVATGSANGDGQWRRSYAEADCWKRGIYNRRGARGIDGGQRINEERS
jgi:general secretion pathway protein A